MTATREQLSTAHHEVDYVPTSVSTTPRTTSKFIDVAAQNKFLHHRQRPSQLSKLMIVRKRNIASGTNYQKSTSENDKPGVRSSIWARQKKLIIEPPSVKPIKRPCDRRPTRPMDTSLMPSPAELKHRPEARKKVMAMYRSAQFTPLDGSKRTGKPTLHSAMQSSKTAGRYNGDLGFTKSRVTADDGKNVPKTVTDAKLNAQTSKPNPSLPSDANALIADDDYSTNQLTVVATESSMTDTSCNMPLYNGNLNKKTDRTAVNISFVNTRPDVLSTVSNLHAASQKVGGSISSVSHIGTHTDRHCSKRVVGLTKLWSTVGNGEKRPQTKLNAQSKTLNPSLQIDAEQLLTEADYSTKPPTVKRDSNIRMSNGDLDKKSDAIAAKISLADSDIVSTSQQVNASSSTASHSGIRVVSEWSHGGLCVMDNNSDEDTDPDRLVIDLDYVDTYESASDHSVTESSSSVTYWPLYDDISEDEDAGDCITSTAGAPVATSIVGQQVVEATNSTSVSHALVDVSKWCTETSQSATLSSQTRPSKSIDLKFNHNSEYIDLQVLLLLGYISLCLSVCFGLLCRLSLWTLSSETNE